MAVAPRDRERARRRLRRVRIGDTFLVTGYDANELPPHGADQPLTPRPNRVDGGSMPGN